MTKSKGRPPVWQHKINAPDKALKLYKMIAELQNSSVFKSCHIFDGAVDNYGVPIFRYEGELLPIPKVLCQYLGIRYGKSHCETRGCVNPYHYAESLPSYHKPPPAILIPKPAPEPDWSDLLKYHILDKDVPAEYEALRRAIPQEDISDEQLRNALAKLKGT